jgi:glycosyltransferase involved in cell wall biosynthesis
VKVLYVYADSPKEWNCSEWNCIIPTKSINKTGNHTASAMYINEFVKNTEESQKQCAEADIIVVERNYFGDTLTMMQFWKVRNKSVVAIFDDAYDIMHPQNISYNFWTHGELKYKESPDGPEKTAHMKPPPIEQFKWGLNMVKGVQVPSVNLAKDWSKYNNTYYIHNFLDVDKYMNVEPLYPHPKEEIVIGWCGSMSHYASFADSGVVQGLRKVASKYPHVKVLIGGDKRVFDLLDVRNKVFQPYVPAEQWTSLLKTLDIGLCPLAGEYDKRRSWIKALEWMALKVPWIASKYPTYDELHDYGLMTENGYKNWAEAITEMVENYPKYKQIADTTSYEFALEQSSDKNIEKVTLALYEKLIDEPYPSFQKEFEANLNFPS